MFTSKRTIWLIVSVSRQNLRRRSPISDQSLAYRLLHAATLNHRTLPEQLSSVFRADRKKGDPRHRHYGRRCSATLLIGQILMKREPNQLLVSL